MTGIQGRWVASPSASCTDGEMCCSDMQRALTVIGRGSVSALMPDNGCRGQEEKRSLPQNFRLLLRAPTVTLPLPLPPFTSSLLSCVSKPAVSCGERKRKRFAFPHMQKNMKQDKKKSCWTSFRAMCVFASFAPFFISSVSLALPCSEVMPPQLSRRSLVLISTEGLSITWRPCFEIFFSLAVRAQSRKTRRCKSSFEGFEALEFKVVTVHSGWEDHFNCFYFVFIYRKRKKKSAKSWTRCSPLLIFSLKLCNLGRWKSSKCLGT